MGWSATIETDAKGASKALGKFDFERKAYRPLKDNLAEGETVRSARDLTDDENGQIKAAVAAAQTLLDDGRFSGKLAVQLSGHAAEDGAPHAAVVHVTVVQYEEGP